MAKKLRVGIIFGGRSGEHEVSLLSAASILQAIDRDKFDVVPIAINKAGHWLTSTAAQGLLEGSGTDRRGWRRTLLARRKTGRSAGGDPAARAAAPRAADAAGPRAGAACCRLRADP